MIENMIANILPYLPLKILEANWDGDILHMHGSLWSFNTLSAWRIVTDTKMVFGCFDDDSREQVNFFKGLDIVEIGFQDDVLKIDPVFILSNGRKLQIFSTDIFEPWTFSIDGLITFVPTPSEPEAFHK